MGQLAASEPWHKPSANHVRHRRARPPQSTMRRPLTSNRLEFNLPKFHLGSFKLFANITRMEGRCLKGSQAGGKPSPGHVVTMATLPQSTTKQDSKAEQVLGEEGLWKGERNHGTFLPNIPQAPPGSMCKPRPRGSGFNASTYPCGGAVMQAAVKTGPGPRPASLCTPDRHCWTTDLGPE